jgi:large subunit ribosomal protein L9
MKVILTKEVQGLGRPGDIKEVSDGHARNFLIPRHLALPATTAALDRLQKAQKEQQAKVLKDQAQLNALAVKLASQTIIITAKASKEHLFASISAKQIAEAINDKLKSEIAPNQIQIQKPIKSLGVHEVEIMLNKVKIKVENA